MITPTRWLSYVLVAFSVAWVFTLLVVPSWITSPLLLCVTVMLISVNCAISTIELFFKGKLLRLVNAVQLPLFCLLNYQVFKAVASDHYRFDHEPGLWDWIELTAVHVLRAADLLDGLDAYGIDLQNVEHSSIFAGVLLVFMHLVVDTFLISLVYTWVRFLVKRGTGKDKAERLEKLLWLSKYVGVVMCVGLILICGITQGWRILDWILWPLDNILRTVDIGDAFQIFNWRLHTVPMGFWTTTLAITFRLFTGVWVAIWINRLRLTWLQGFAATVDDLLQSMVNEDDPLSVRKAAALALLRINPTHLVNSLADKDPKLRLLTYEALCEIGPETLAKFPDVVKALKRGKPVLHTKRDDWKKQWSQHLFWAAFVVIGAIVWLAFVIISQFPHLLEFASKRKTEHKEQVANLSVRLELDKSGRIVSVLLRDEVMDADLKKLTRLTQLQKLDARRTRVTDAGLKQISGMTNLRTLILCENRVTDAGLKQLSGLTNLRSLNLERTRVSDAGLKELTSLTQLRELDLSRTLVMGEGLKQISGLTNLRTLHLRYTKVTDKDIQILAVLTQLEELELYETSVTDAGVLELKQKLPNCDINH